jgi:hypothetical protein
VCQGGLGLFRIAEFTLTLQCSWIKRAMTLQHDNWRNDFNICNEKGILFIQDENLQNFGPVMRGIGSNFIKFRNLFGTVGNNFLNVPILNNQFFFPKERALDDEFFRMHCIFRGNLNKYTLCWANLSNNGQFFSRDQIRDITAIEITPEGYLLLKKAFLLSFKKFFSETDRENT